MSSPTSSKPINREFTVDLSDAANPRHSMFFDEFGLRRAGDLVEMHFAYYGRSRIPQQGLILIMAKEAVDSQKEPFLTYVQQQGTLPDKPSTDKWLDVTCPVEAADFMGAARQGKMAEILFHAVSWRLVVNTMKVEGKPDPMIKAQCVALLRCSVEMQQQWILALYEPVKGKS